MASSEAQITRPTHKRAHGSMAFIVESLILLVFLVSSLAIVSQLLLASADKAVTSLHLENAVTLATNTAERFSADPSSSQLDATQDGLVATCEVTPQATDMGTLYTALITVSDDNGEVYSITTSRYVSGVRP